MSKKEDKVYFNSQEGKVNIMLLFSIVLIFILSVIYAEAVPSVVTYTPGNFTFNGSRNINFTWTVNWQAAGDNKSNCTIWVNSTTNNLTWSSQKVVDIDSNNSNNSGYIVNATGTGANLSYANITLPGDGNFTWSVGCYVGNSSTTLTFPAVGSVNRTFYIDTLAPVITLETMKGGILADSTAYNITSYDTAVLYINVSDNTTQYVWLVLTDNASVTPAAILLGGPAPGMNETVNRTLTAGTVISAPDGRRQYYYNLSGFLDFNSSFTSPGPHSLIFCANDTFNRITCTNRSDFIIMGGNITQIERIFSGMQQKTSAGDFNGPSFGGLNITLGNGTEIPEGAFMNPITGVTVDGVTHKNFTFIINISNDILIHIVAGTINADQFGNASNTHVNNTPSSEIAAQVGRFSATMVWADIASFIPSEVSYLYGILQLRGTGYSKKMYCNGTSVGDPQCHKINECNSTAFGIYNHTLAIPTNDACWLEPSNSKNILINTQNLSFSFTYIFVDHFSGGLGGSDYSQINGTFNGVLRNDINTTTARNLINFTLEDINSTGLNLTLNYSINLSIFQSTTKLLEFSYLNTSSSNLTCISSDTVSPQNTTSVTCNVTFTFSNGTYRVVITARDTSNNSNQINTSSSNITVTVDQIPPRVFYFNITNSSILNASGSDGSNESYELGLGDGVSRAQGDTTTGIIFAKANWTDNLTRPFEADLQFYNVTKNGGVGEWQTINTTKSAAVNDSDINITPSGTSVGGWSNFSFFIPRVHGEFEGTNISFRIIANDTLGNVNNSATVRNITIQINDTTKPTLLVSSVGGVDLNNNTNISDTTPTIVWNVTEPNHLRYVAISVDAASAVNGTACNKFVNYTQADALSDANRNGSIIISSTGTCPLRNGTHIAELRTEDSWGNYELYIHSFSLQSGSVPTIDFTFLSNLNASGLSAKNTTNVSINVTPFTTMNFSTLVGGTGILRNLSWTSSCNSSSNLFTNNSVIAPFNYSGCKGTSANRTVTITVFDTAGNFNSSVFGFLVDNLGPSLAVTTPTDGFSSTSNISISLSAKDDSQRIDQFGYYLDNNYQIVVLNVSGSWGGAAENITLTNVSNFTPGTHTIKFSVNDTLGNAVNSSTITFTGTGSVQFGDRTISMQDYAEKVFGSNVTNVTININTGTGYVLTNLSNETSTNTFEIVFNSILNNTNISLRDINGSAVNWDKVNFTAYLYLNQSLAGIQNNWTTTVLRSVVFNNTLEEFTNNNNNSYYGVVVFPLNLSNPTASGPEFWWIPNVGDLTTRTNISQCDTAFTRTRTTPCWNYTAGGKTIIQVPHFSAVVVVNDTTAPTLTINTPVATTGNQTVGAFVPNMTVSSDTLSCVYQANGSTPIVMTKSGTICLGQTESRKNLNVGYNITFNATDASGNVASRVFHLNVSDNTPPNTPNSSVVSSSPSSTTATISIANVNETVNVTVFFGTAISSLGSVAMETDFNQSQSVSLSSLTASTLYHFNVSICDFNGNCIKNGTFNFTTSAAAAAAAATTTTSSGASGGGGGAAPSAEVASAARRWDTLDSGSSAVLAVNNENIAVTGVVVDVANTVTNAEVKVASLSSNPLTTGAGGGKVYQYLQLTKTNIADTDASKITVNFRVLKSWLTSNGVAETSIVLYRYSESKWNPLPTTKTGDDANNVLYQSITPGFSTFAIGTTEAPPAAPAPEVPAEAPAEAPVEAPAAPATPPAPEAMEKKPLSRTTLAWIVVGIIVIVAAAGYFMMQRRKNG